MFELCLKLFMLVRLNSSAFPSAVGVGNGKAVPGQNSFLCHYFRLTPTSYKLDQHEKGGWGEFGVEQNETPPIYAKLLEEI
jgi:hypothetical protein